MNRQKWVAVGFCVFWTIACESEPQTGPASDPVVQEAVGEPASPLEERAERNPLPFGYDEWGRLKPAEGLVNGFEVPVGLRLLRETEGYLEFQLVAPVEDILEFYAGVDDKNNRRFSDRHYQLDQGPMGTEVRHTTEGLRRLGISEDYRDGHLFVTNEYSRTQTIRVHTPPRAARPADNPYLSPVNFESRTSRAAAPSPSPRTPPPHSPPPAGQAQSPASPTPGLTNPTVSSERAALVRQATEAARQRWGPYGGPGRTTDVKERIRRWREANPGQVFLD